MKYSDLKAGDTVIVDAGFPCVTPGPHFVYADEDGCLYIPCQEGRHLLDAQVGPGEQLIGLSWPEPAYRPAIHPAPTEFTEDEIQTDHVLQFFHYSHLPSHMQTISAPFCQLARQLVDYTPRNPERTVALRKLIEAKDAAVRSTICAPRGGY